MARAFHLVSTSSFERDVRTLTKRNFKLLSQIQSSFDILEEDPHNTSRHYPIKKLVGVKPGQGQWRIRLGNFRLRYDIVGADIILYSFKHRKEAY